MNTNSIQYIRKNIGKIRVTNYRLLKGDKNLHTIKEIRNNKLQDSIFSKGGKVTLELTTNNGCDLYAEAVCSKRDSFNRKVGISIAIGRLFKQLENK